MPDLQSALETLRTASAFTPEYEGTDVPSAMEKRLAALIETYPPLKTYSCYLEFLRMTGGAHIHSPEYTLGIFGFGGYVVPSFEEGNFLDSERYFIFGDVLYSFGDSITYYFAFDFHSKDDSVYMAAEESDEYVKCCQSFLELLFMFADRKYPGVSRHAQE